MRVFLGTMHVDLEDLRDRLDELEGEGVNYAKTRRIARDLDNSNKEVAKALVTLEEQDEVDRWSSGTPLTWEIRR